MTKGAGNTMDQLKTTQEQIRGAINLEIEGERGYQHYYHREQKWQRATENPYYHIPANEYDGMKMAEPV